MELTLNPILKDKSLVRDSKAITGCYGKKETFEETKRWLQGKRPNLNDIELKQVTEDFLASIYKITK